MSDIAEFHSAITRREHAIEVRYEILNKGHTSIGVLNAMHGFDIDRTLTFSPDHVYAHIEDGTLHLTKGALPVPDGLFVGAHTPPNARRLAPGETLRESFTVPLPARVRHPFKRAMLTGEVIASRPTMVRRVTFSVGVVVTGERCHLISEHPAYPDVMTVFPTDAVLSSQILLSETRELDRDLAALDYQGHPWRS